MIVAKLDVVRVAHLEPEADPPLIVDGDRELPAAIAGQRMQPITGWRPQVVNARRGIHRFQLAQGAANNLGRNATRPPSDEALFCTPIRERLDHSAV